MSVPSSDIAKVQIWTNASEEAMELEGLIQARGYQVDPILSGYNEPIVEYKGMWLCGYTEIRSWFLGQ